MIIIDWYCKDNWGEGNCVSNPLSFSDWDVTMVSSVAVGFMANISGVDTMFSPSLGLFGDLVYQSSDT